MNGSRILMQGEPKGNFLEGTVSGTPYPGTLMQLVAATAPISGEFTWQVYTPSANGDPRLTAVLIEDSLEGFAYSTAYVTGARCFIYCPLPGDYLNMLVAGQPGTGSTNVFSIGNRFIGQTGTGLLVVTATSSQGAPFQCMENITLTPDTQGWVWCQKT